MVNRELGNFDGFAKDYEHVQNKSIRFSGADRDFFSEHKIKIVRRMEPGEGISILDLGCGDGNSAPYFRHYFPECDYSGVDTSRVSLDLAEQTQGSERSVFVHYDGEKIPFGDGSFDLVFAACVFHHIHPSAHTDVLGEVKRVLRPSGRLYLFEHNPLNPLTRRVVKSCRFDEDAILLRAAYTRRMLRESGFQKIETGYTVFFPYHRIFRGLHALEPYLKRLPIGGQYYARAVREGRDG
ncbi:MAG: class I SAM-dependent methyltransferase [Acidobacteria bacterium]|nr:class I SAM-dependent methyltransferase [Acidobacteriota bacterium]